MNKYELQAFVERFVVAHPSVIERFTEKVRRFNFNEAKEYVGALILEAVIVKNLQNDDYKILRYVNQRIDALDEGGIL